MRSSWLGFFFVAVAAHVFANCTFFSVQPRPPQLIVEPFVTRLTPLTLNQGQLLVGVHAERGTPGTNVRFELVIDGLVVDAQNSRTTERIELRYRPAPLREKKQRLVVRGVLDSGKEVGGGLGEDIVVNTLPLDIGSIEVSPVVGITDSLDVKVTMAPGSPAPTSASVSVNQQETALLLPQLVTRLSQLTPGKLETLTVTVRDDDGNVTTGQASGGASVFFIGSAAAGVATGSSLKPYASFAAGKAATSSMAQVWFQLLAGEFAIGDTEPPWQLTPGQHLRGTVSESGELLTSITGRGSIPPLIAGVAGCTTLFVAGSVEVANAISVSDLRIRAGEATGACPARPDGIVSANAKLELSRLDISGMQSAVRLQGMEFAQIPKLDRVKVRETITGVEAFGNTWPRLSRLDYDGRGLELGTGLRWRADVHADEARQRFATLSASTIASSVYGIRVEGQGLLVLSAAEGSRNKIQLEGSATPNIEHVGLLTGDTSTTMVCGTDFDLAANVSAPASVAYSAMRWTTTERAFVGNARTTHVAATSHCALDPRVTVTNHGYGNAIIISSFGAGAGFGVTDFLARDVGPAREPPLDTDNRTAGILAYGVQPVTESFLRRSRIAGYEVALHLPMGADPRSFRVISSCLNPITTAGSANPDWSVQLTDATGYVAPRSISASTFQGVDSSREARPVNFVISGVGDILVDQGEAACPATTR